MGQAIWIWHSEYCPRARFIEAKYHVAPANDSVPF